MNNFDEKPKEMTSNLPLWSFQFQPNSSLALKTRKDLEIHLITRALKDENFKRELLGNPKQVINKELGAELPEELEIHVLEEAENTIYMVLPRNPYGEISEEDLKDSLGLNYEDVAQWVLEQGASSFLDEESSVLLLSKIWRQCSFKEELLRNPKAIVEKELSVTLGVDAKLQVFEETDQSLYTIIPRLGDVNISEEVDKLLTSQGDLILKDNKGTQLLTIGVITSQCGGAGSCPTNS